MNAESWKPVQTHGGKWVGIYEVSDAGRVRVDPLCRRQGSEPGRVLFQGSDDKGYPQVGLCMNYACTTVKVHRLVAEAFLGARPAGRQVNHKNGDKTDNYVQNLEYVTNQENVDHAIKTLRTGSWVVRGERMSVGEAVRRYAAPGVGEQAVRRRVGRYGWEVDRALSTPMLPTGRQKA
jgi:hypothetical protein